MTVNNDEAVARALHAQYEAEYRRGSSRNPPIRTIAVPQSYATDLPPPSITVPRTSNQKSRQESIDAELALRLSLQLEDDESYQGGTALPRSTLSNSARPPESWRPPSSVSDEDLARRVAQELRDEEIARAVQMEEANQRHQQQIAAAPLDRGCGVRRCMVTTITFVVVFFAILGIYLAIGRSVDGGGFGGFWPDEDPWEGADPSKANKWNNGNRPGLELQILNAVDQNWAPFVARAIREWDDGIPDALTLSTFERDPEPGCKSEEGKLKICNGDYGNTKWRGINEVLLQGGFIIASTARLNDFYVIGEDAYQRQYTSCHEIGHGFGLPHTDENFYNADLGNCMDYTSNPSANQSPDQGNYEFLVDLYGEISYRRRLRTRSDMKSITNESKVPAHILERHMKAVEDIAFGDRDLLAGSGWRMLHRNGHGEAHQIDLGDGYKLLVRLSLEE